MPILSSKLVYLSFSLPGFPRCHFKTGLTYRPREAVFFPYWIAETGQRLMQPQHLRHFFFVQAGRPSTISIAPAGQIEAHFPQWTHFSSA